MRLRHRLLAAAARPGSTFGLVAIVLVVLAVTADARGDDDTAQRLFEGAVASVVGLALWPRFERWRASVAPSDEPR